MYKHVGLLLFFREPRYKIFGKEHYMCTAIEMDSWKQGSLQCFHWPPYCSSIHSLAYDILQTKTKEKGLFNSSESALSTSNLKDLFPFHFFYSFYFLLYVASNVSATKYPNKKQPLIVTCIGMQVNVGKIRTIEVSNIEISDNV